MERGCRHWKQMEANAEAGKRRAADVRQRRSHHSALAQQAHTPPAAAVTFPLPLP